MTDIKSEIARLEAVCEAAAVRGKKLNLIATLPAIRIACTGKTDGDYLSAEAVHEIIGDQDSLAIPAPRCRRWSRRGNQSTQSRSAAPLLSLAVTSTALAITTVCSIACSLSPARWKGWRWSDD
jgi:hypothetical protein